MLFVPKKGPLLVETNRGAVGAVIQGTAVTTGAGSTTKGAVAQLIAATARESYWLRVVASNYSASAAASEGCLDILIGASTEDVLIANLLMGNAGGSDGTVDRHGPKIWDFPLYIPAGQRIAAQAAGIRLSTAMHVCIYLWGGDGYPAYRCGQKVTTYGVTVPNGTTITQGASGAQGAWTQISAASSEDHFAFVPSFQITTDTTINRANQIVGIGYGAATEEIIGDWHYGTNALEAVCGPYDSMPAFRDVASGSRLVMRISSSNTVEATANACIHAVS